MSATTPRPALILDSAQMERLLTTMHDGGAAVATTVQLRLRYLQRNGFPNDRAGRGKRATYDLADIVRVLLAFELLDLELTPQRATATVQHSWTVLARSVVPAWVALRRTEAADHDEVAPEMDALKRVAVVQPAALRDDGGGLIVGLLRPSMVAEIATAGGDELRHAIIIDLFALVRALDRTMRGEGFGLTAAEIDAAFERFGAEVFGTTRTAEWRPPADE